MKQDQVQNEVQIMTDQELEQVSGGADAAEKMLDAAAIHYDYVGPCPICNKMITTRTELLRHVANCGFEPK